MEGSCMVPWTKSGIRGTKRGERGQRSGQGPEVFSESRGLGEDGQWDMLRGRVGQGPRHEHGGLHHKGRKDKRGLGGVHF